MKYRNWRLWFILALAWIPLAGAETIRQEYKNSQATLVGRAAEPILPMEGTAWVDEEGMRIAWIKFKHCDDTMIENLIDSRVNTLILKSAFHDLLDLENAHWDDGKLVLPARPKKLAVAIDATDRATAKGIHVMWLASYELESMLPHLTRLGYHHAYVEGPTRFVSAGPHRDAAALDPVFWRGITGAYGDIVAKQSVDHAIEGILFDTEHYDGGMMYLQGCGFADVSFGPYLQAQKIGKSLADLPVGSRYEFLKNHGLLPGFFHYMEEQAYDQGRYLADRWRALNPHLMIGTWPCFDNWFSQGMLRGMGGATRAVGLSGVEYFHGSEQSPAMAEYFESKNRNLIYSPGFYPPYSYTPDQLEEHVAYAISTLGTYWMLSPNGAIARADYRQALRSAFEQGTVPIANDKRPVNIDFHVDRQAKNPVLVATTRESIEHFEQPPKLSLRAAFGGATLCENQPMQETGDGRYRAVIKLNRRLTNNRHLSDGFRSGASYRYDPLPNEMFYEDTHHTKLCDGRAYGYFGTTVAWPNTIDDAEAVFDLHRPYQITRVQIAQPAKLEDRTGGPTQLGIDLAIDRGAWSENGPLMAVFPVWSEKDDDAPDSFVNDQRHHRAWLSWETESIDEPARWVRVRLHLVKSNSCLSLGQVVIWGYFDGEIQTSLRDGDSMRVVTDGRRFLVPKL